MIKFTIAIPLLKASIPSQFFYLLQVEVVVIALYIVYALAMKELYGITFSDLKIIGSIDSYKVTVCTSAFAYTSFMLTLFSIMAYGANKDVTEVLNTIAIGLLFVTSACFALLVLKTWKLTRERIYTKRATERFLEEFKN